MNNVAEIRPNPFRWEQVQEIHVQRFGIGAEGRDRHHIIRVKRDNAYYDHEEIQRRLQHTVLDAAIAQLYRRQQRHKDRGQQEPQHAGVLHRETAERFAYVVSHPAIKEQAIHFCK